MNDSNDISLADALSGCAYSVRISDTDYNIYIGYC